MNLAQLLDPVRKLRLLGISNLDTDLDQIEATIVGLAECVQSQSREQPAASSDIAVRVVPNHRGGYSFEIGGHYTFGNYAHHADAARVAAQNGYIIID